MLIVDGDVNRVFDQLQHANAVRGREQRERRQVAEVELLDGTSYREYRARRDAQPHLLVEPGLPEDEMTYLDYRVSKTHDVSGAPPDDPVLVLRDEENRWTELGFETEPILARLPKGTGERE